MLEAFFHCLKNDIRVMLRNRAQWVYPILFFIIFIALFGIGLGDSSFAKVSPAVVWIGFLLTSLFTVEAMFRQEWEEGVLEQLLLSPYPLWWLILAKALAFWLASCLPLILILPLLGAGLGLTLTENGVLILSLLLGSPALTLVGVIGSALTIALPRSGVFLGLLLLPLYVPILILGESTVLSLLSSQWPIFQMVLLLAISVLAITLAPHAASAALRAGMEG